MHERRIEKKTQNIKRDDFESTHILLLPLSVFPHLLIKQNTWSWILNKEKINILTDLVCLWAMYQFLLCCGRRSLLIIPQHDRWHHSGKMTNREQSHDKTHSQGESGTLHFREFTNSEISINALWRWCCPDGIIEHSATLWLVAT